MNQGYYDCHTSNQIPNHMNENNKGPVAPKSAKVMEFITSRFGFTFLCCLSAAILPVALIFVLPFISPNSAIQVWTASDSLFLAASIMSGPFAFASPPVNPSWIAVVILIPCCFSYALRPRRITMAATIVSWNIWMLSGLVLSFVSV